MATTGIVIDSAYIKHELSGHIERPDRVRSIAMSLCDSGLESKCKFVPARRATKSEVCLAHTTQLYEQLAATRKGEPDTVHHIDGDTYANTYSFDAALKAAGGLIRLTKRVLSGKLSNGFAIIRPPGHHAELTKSMGFCLFNNVVIAAKVAQKTCGVKKILIIDWDVHHGNGTQHILEDDPSIMYFSVHKGGGFYPNTGYAEEIGIGKGKGFTVNVPFLHAGMGDGDYLACFKYVFLPIAREFNPDLVIVSAGFDCGKNDIVGPMKVSTKGFEQMMEMVLTLANGNVVCALEGGYTLRTTAKGAVGCIGVLTGQEARSVRNPIPTNKGMMDIISAIDIQKKYWDCMRHMPKNPEFRDLCRQVFPTAVVKQSYWRLSEISYGSSKKRKRREGFLVHYPPLKRARLFDNTCEF